MNHEQSRAIAHDFNNLLTLILGHAYFIESDKEASPDSIAAAAAIRIAAQRAGLIARQLAGLNAVREKVDMHSLVDEAVAVVQPRLAAGVTIDRRLAASTRFVIGDPGVLFQMMFNLVLNASDAMPAGGVLGAYSDGCGPIRLTVADNGSGIDADLQSRMFEESFTTKIGEHRGLGLSIVKRAVDLHGGRIEVESELHRGSRFHVILPAHA
jgi:signal transduction histidine kinase